MYMWPERADEFGDEGIRLAPHVRADVTGR